ncbi:MAG: hypothetical protein RIQ56_326 [Candidatus Parcubacteria bacterium]
MPRDFPIGPGTVALIFLAILAYFLLRGMRKEVNARRESHRRLREAEAAPPQVRQAEAAPGQRSREEPPQT